MARAKTTGGAVDNEPHSSLIELHTNKVLAIISLFTKFPPKGLYDYVAALISMHNSE
jgi:hypothetical protein